MSHQPRLNIARDFSPTPGSRFIREGEHSGEHFRQSVLAPRLQEAKLAATVLTVEMDGTAGYGTSFLEEAFGGLIRHDGFSLAELKACLYLVSREEPYLVDDVWEYLGDEEARRGKK
jgi:hypothetical protein